MTAETGRLYFERYPVCDGDLVLKEVEKLLRGGNHTAVLTVKAELCHRCGERLYSRETIERFAEGGQSSAGKTPTSFRPLARHSSCPRSGPPRDVSARRVVDAKDRTRKLVIALAQRLQKPGSGSSLAALRERTARTRFPDLTSVLGPIPWAVAGAVATRRYMPERATQALDIVVRAEEAETVR